MRDVKFFSKTTALRLAGAALLFPMLAGQAIEAPKPAAAPEPQSAEPPPKVEVTPTDETTFYERLQFVTQRRNLVGLKLNDDVHHSLARGSVDTVVNSLNSQAMEGDRDSNIALIRIQHWCNRMVSGKPPDMDVQLARFAPMVPDTRLPRIAGVMAAEKPYQERAKQSCMAASFKYRSIETRLRDAAAAGDPASATELAQFVRDFRQRESLLQQAVEKDFAPAMYSLATSRLIAVQRGETTEDVASIRLLFKQAGRTLPKAKVDFANCVAVGCDGHPANTATAAAFGLDAARDGEPTAFLSMVRMPWGRQVPRVKLLAWQYYGDRLNEAGCTGDGYIANAVSFAQSISALEKDQDPKLLEEAKSQADNLWNQHSARAMSEQGCG